MAKLEIRVDEGARGDTVTLPLAAGDILLDRLLQHEVEIGHDYGGKLACASCRVVVHEGLDGLAAPTDEERDLLELARATQPGSRLACQAVPGSGDVLIEIPELRDAAPVCAIPGNPLALSERAAAHFKLQLARCASAVGVRISVRSSGCSGYRYGIDYADAIDADDVSFLSRGIRIAIDRASLALVHGTTLDVVKEGLQQRLRFDNPNARQSCGCGESFALQDRR
jgi:iron-sulfur cluster assembly protein